MILLLFVSFSLGSQIEKLNKHVQEYSRQVANVRSDAPLPEEKMQHNITELSKFYPTMFRRFANKRNEPKTTDVDTGVDVGNEVLMTEDLEYDEKQSDTNKNNNNNNNSNNSNSNSNSNSNNNNKIMYIPK